MNQKEIKEIAGIIKNRIELIKTNITKKYQEILLAEMKLLANEFADCFEREDKKEKAKAKKPYGMDKKGFNLWWRFHYFNKKQFKEWCGVE